MVLFTFVLLGGFFVRMDLWEILFTQKIIGEDMNLINFDLLVNLPLPRYFTWGRWAEAGETALPWYQGRLR